MNKKWFLTVAIVLILVISTVIHFRHNRETTSQVSPAVSQSYYSDVGTEVNLITGDDVVFSGIGYTEVTLKSEVSASGARYTNETGELTVWNRGDELSVYENDTLIFTGKTTRPLEPLIPAEELPQQAVISLTDFTWVWQKTLYNNKPTFLPKNSNLFQLTFLKDTTFSATTDCNSISGNYSVSESILSFDSLMSTLMACDGSDESAFTQMLEAVTRYTINDSGELILNLRDEEGSMYFTQHLESR
jgi:heat shock protein HslJ/membrane-bound inhibitor of C-type lysozyme